METRFNKIIVAEFYKKIVGQRDSSLINPYVREDYIQHSAMGKPGREGLFEMIEFLKTLPPSTETVSPVKMLIGDDDMVVILLDISFMGKRMLVIDLFKLEDGMLAEHWDAVQEIPHQQSELRIVSTTADTLANKQLVNRFYQEVFINKRKELLNQYLSPDYITHTEALETYSYYQLKVHRIIGEDDLVVVQAELVKGDVSFALYDIFRIQNSLIAEHWGIQQQIPSVMLHSNGMF